MRKTINKICICEACKYTFQYEGSQIPSRCTDCGQTQYMGHPSIRKATKEEIADYWRIQKELEKELGVGD